MKPPKTLGSLATLAFPRIWSGTKAEDSAASNLRFLVSALGPSTRIGSIDPEVLKDACRSAGNSPATTNRKLSALSRLLRWAKGRGWVESIPPVEYLTENRGRIRWPTDAEETRLLEIFESWGHSQYADLVRVLADTGLRVSEALRLRWGDFNPETRLVTVWISKGNRARSVPASERVARVFEGSSGPGPFHGLKSNTLNFLWNRAKREMGLQDDPEFVPHCLRHGVASRLVQGGVPLPMVREILGHARIETTMIYAHLAPKNLEHAAVVLDRKLPMDS